MEYFTFSLKTKMLSFFGQNKVTHLKTFEYLWRINLFFHCFYLTGRSKYFLSRFIAILLHTVPSSIDLKGLTNVLNLTADFEAGKLHLKFIVTKRKCRFSESSVNTKNILGHEKKKKKKHCNPEKPNSWEFSALLAPIFCIMIFSGYTNIDI